MKILLLIFLFISACGKSQNSESITIEVKKGQSFYQTAIELKQKNIIDDLFQFRLAGKISGKDSQLKAGTYQIPAYSSYDKILDIISSGIGIFVPVTIREGWNIFEIAALLEDKGITSAKDFFQALTDPNLFKKYDLLPPPTQTIKQVRRFTDRNNNHYASPTHKVTMLDGFLFPETYYLHSNMNATNVIKIFTDKFDEVLKEEKIDQLLKKHNYTLNELITLSSIIQKEAVDIKEMPKVAGVYINRLHKKMKLQADPTIIYALLLDNEYSGNIRTKHVRPPWPSPYNTYYIDTLPPTPIANPGREAILSVFNYEKHPYIYFVRKPDGSHKYSITLSEHNKAVQEWVNYQQRK